MPAIQQQRREKMMEICNNMNSLKIEPSKLKRIVVDDRRKILMCLLNKGASSTMTRLILYSNHLYQKEFPNVSVEQMEVHSIASYQMTLLSHYNQDQIKCRIDNYFSFMFSRHPLIRLVSAFRDRFTRRGPMYASKAKDIIMKYRLNQTNIKVGTTSDVQFHEFAKFIATEGDGTDRHWKSMQDLYC